VSREHPYPTELGPDTDQQLIEYWAHVQLYDQQPTPLEHRLAMGDRMRELGLAPENFATMLLWDAACAMRDAAREHLGLPPAE